MFDLHKYLDKKFDLIYMNPPFNISNLINKKVRLLDIHLRMTEHEVSIFSCAWFCVQTEFFAFASVDSG